ncbi:MULTISPECIES: ATP-dependent RecD-like DNA helicase [Pseudomonadota]|uniref:ATP-dependent DNA helicase n=1 Tax=Pseudomonadota TaxID=1224 RepID=UPI00272EF258|nr:MULTISPECIES: AAA family ATPase [Pseudomonadota]MDP1627646.1 AAA family ATPase [Parvibaculum sp.]MDP2243748.1 AAA family ATPase [Pseudomonas sp.]
MMEGARKLPPQHISIRVPWHDSGWSGRICQNPLGNTHCVALPRIGDNRDDTWEASVRGELFDTEGGPLPACASERGAFMADFSYERRIQHPYGHNELYAHFRRTTYIHAPRSASAVPFAWMMKADDGLPEIANRLALGFRPELEPELGFDSIWVQERRNQLVMLDTFFGAIEPTTSLVFFYAKKTPLTEDPRRVIVGIGRVIGVSGATEYAYENAAEDALRSMMWERNVSHSIKPEIGDGFLLPYGELLELSKNDADFDLQQFVLHAPDENFAAFSMGSEHVSHDQAVSVLLSAVAVVGRYEALLPGDWSAARSWIDTELNRLWRLRGAYPGLGSALSAMGLPNGTLLAHAVGGKLYADGGEDIRDPWPVVESVLHDPKQLPQDLAGSVGPAAAKLWDTLRPERRDLLKLLARFELSADQAQRWWVQEKRAQAGIDLADRAILTNPYLCFEADRGRVDSIPLPVIDRGLFPDPHVLAAIPIPAPSACAEAIDPRRGRALIIQALEDAAQDGHTLLPQDWLVERVRDAEVSPPCAITGDWIAAFEESFAPELEEVETATGASGWQLNRYAATRTLIGTRIKRRLGGARHAGEYDWPKLIDDALGGPAKKGDATEEMARKEKASALEELFRSRSSVLIGPAGTGKTTLLLALLSLDQVHKGGVLLLAPTGKARVQMQKKAGDVKAFTLAQFLLGLDRYDAQTGAYLVTGASDRENGFATVVIDEASMLTEDQLAATLDALDPSSVQRLILVGDPRQLPPIGAGRPFVDVIRLLRDQDTNPVRGLAELTVVRRQSGGSDDHESPRDDVLLSRWFSGEAPDAGADEIWDRLAAGSARGVRAIRWEGDADLQAKLLEELTTHIRSGADASLKDDTAFEVSLGGTEFNGRGYFHPSKPDDDGRRQGGGAGVEAWQILAPIRDGETGVVGLNRWIKRLFRVSVRGWAEVETYWHRKITKPMGSQAILYGDKVINLSNGRRHDVYPKPDKAYLANGEIGLVVGQYKGRNWKPKRLPWKLEVEFSTQLGFKFGFGSSDFGEDGNERLELAYALTIHKAQGSEFGTTFVIVPNPCRLLSRELLYTALTRQQRSVILFHQGDLRDLKKLSGADHSETARRLTNLFTKPKLVAYSRTFLEEGLIHRTTRGELVRSKSEVIIADLLNSLELPYSYEQPFTAPDGSVRYPDFTVDDAETGRRLLIEHLGMMDRPDYVWRWKAKEKWYRDAGVMPVADGEAEVGLLTTTEVGGLDAAAIKAQIVAALGL